MIKLEIDPIQEGKKLVLMTEEDIRVRDLINKIGVLFKEEGEGMLISCDKEGVLPPDESLYDLNIASGERLIYLKRT